MPPHNNYGLFIIHKLEDFMDKKELKEIRSELINQFESGITVEQLCDKYSAKWCDMYDMISISLRHSIKEISEFEKYQIKI